MISPRYGFPEIYPTFVLITLLATSFSLVIVPMVLRNRPSIIGAMLLFIAILLSFSDLGRLFNQVALLALLGIGGATLSSALLQKAFRNRTFFNISILTICALVGLGAMSVMFHLILASWSEIPDAIGFHLFFYSMVTSWVFLTLAALYSSAYWYFEARAGHSA